MAEAILAQVGSCKSILTALNGRPGVAKVSEQEGRRLQQALRCTAVANDDMGRIAHAIKEAGFQEGDEQALLDVVADVASSRVSAPCAKMQRTSTQDWLEFVHYIPGNIWHELEQGLVNGFMDFLFRLGLRHPSEPTFSLMATMTCVQADGLDKVLNMADEVKLQYVGSIKAMFRSQLENGWRLAITFSAFLGSPKSSAGITERCTTMHSVVWTPAPAQLRRCSWRPSWPEVGVEPNGALGLRSVRLLVVHCSLISGSAQHLRTRSFCSLVKGSSWRCRV